MDNIILNTGDIILYTHLSRNKVGYIKALHRHTGDYLVSGICVEGAEDTYRGDIFVGSNNIIKVFDDCNSIEEFEDKYPEYYL